MRIEPIFPLSTISARRTRPTNYPDIKPWVIKAIAEEEKRPTKQLWKDEPSKEYRRDERLQRIKFLHKHQRADPAINLIADRLASCERNNRCCSGACPECGRLLQRWFVRKSKKLICEEIARLGRQLVVISIIPSDPIIRPGKLRTLSIMNFKRRLKYALDKGNLDLAIGGIDFSFNEDRNGTYKPFWCPHFYLVASIANKSRTRKALDNMYRSERRRNPRPIKISDFENSAYCRSYAFKTYFSRRIGLDKRKANNDGTTRKCRNTSHDKLRVAELLELCRHLDQIGLAQRLIFRRVKPVIKSGRVTFGKI